MATNICRLCRSLTTNNIDIFRTNGLKYKIETCLPIILYQPCLLPDTICTQCMDNVNSFYTFTKNCIQNLLVLESQYDVAESCLRAKRKHDRGCSADIIKKDAEELSDITYDITKYKERCEAFQRLLDGSERLLNQSSPCETQVQLVDYEDSLDSCEYDLDIREEARNCVDVVRSSKRKIGDILPYRTKMYKFCSNRRRKNTQPKKLAEKKKSSNEKISCIQAADDGIVVPIKQSRSVQHRLGQSDISTLELSSMATNSDHGHMPQEVIEAEVVCLLCDALFTGSDALATHVLHMHGIDMATIISSEPVPEMVQYQQLSPLLAGQRDEKMEEEYAAYLPQGIVCPQDDQQIDMKLKSQCTVVNGRRQKKSTSSKPTSKTPSLKQSAELPNAPKPFGCTLCLAVLPNRADLFTHLRLKHTERAALICGLCVSPNINSFSTLHTHLEQCKEEHEIVERYYCKVCCYSDNSTKTMEIHIAVHEFLAIYCKEEKKLFDPEEYIEHNPHNSTIDESFHCEDCQEVFLSLSDYVAHRRLAHEIFVCDLCNKSYGRSSHLWKHVHRLHKGHPTVTCPVCEKTSASKYHLAQHFVKVHTKAVRTDFLSKKFAAFDFQSVRQSFMKQELTVETETPRFVCPVCAQSFSKRSSLRKHTANCRTRPQKDLLTRCISCSRIFKDRQSLAKHLLNYHSEYTCEICATMVISKCEIVSHIRFVHPNCKLFCQQCGEILRTQSELIEHISDHDNSNVCQFCGDLLDSKIKLKMHILSLHRKILSLSCGICLKLFDDQHRLRDHVQHNHKNELNPLTSCTICGKNYGSKWKAYDHLNKSHGKMFHACRNCLAVFDEQSKLTQHCELGVCSAIKRKEHEVTKIVVNGNNNDLDPTGDSLDSNDNNRDLEEDNKSSCSEVIGDNLDVKIEPQSDEVGEMSEESDREVVDGKTEEVNDKNDDLKKKMCLLEKRLLGEGVGKDVENVVGVCRKEKSNKADILPPQLLPLLPSSATTGGGKRTVYVDASAPACCDICSKTWPAKKHLWQHYIRCHRIEAATVCGICLRTNGGSYAHLQRHLDEEHADLLYGQGYGSNFICRVCGRYHNARSKLRMHMAIHTGYVADKGRGSCVARNITIRDEPPDNHEYGQANGNEDNTEANPANTTDKVPIDIINSQQDLHRDLQSVHSVHPEGNSLNFDCQIVGVDGSSSSNSTSDDDDDDDSDDDDAITAADNTDPNDTTTILSTSTDSTTDSTTTIQDTQPQDIDTSSTATTIEDDQAPTNDSTASIADAQVQLTNAVQSINALELVDDDTDTCARDTNDVDAVDSAGLPLLDGAVGQLSHELQSAVDSIL